MRSSPGDGSPAESDRRRIYAACALRGAAVNFAGIVFGLYLARRGFSPARIGLAVSVGLAGCAAATLAATLFADRFGRRRSLVAVALAMAAGGVALAWSPSAPLLFLAAFVGMVNGMGRERGASLTVDQAILPRTTGNDARTRAFAIYNVAGDVGSAAGAILASLPALLQDHAGFGAMSAYRASWCFYSLLCLAISAVVGGLSAEIERQPDGAAHPAPARSWRLTTAISPASRAVVARFTALSALDSLGGGFLSSALISYWFFRRFGFDEAFLGPFFFAVRVLNALSHLVAARLARKIGLVNTMVFTHLPSSLLLMVAPTMSHPGAVVALFLVRESLVEMDVPTRQSYLAAVLPDRDRTPAAGLANLVRNASWAVAPAGAGALMGTAAISAPLVGGAALKVIYDLLLFASFRRLKPPEEGGALRSSPPPAGRNGIDRQVPR